MHWSNYWTEFSKANYSPGSDCSHELSDLGQFGTYRVARLFSYVVATTSRIVSPRPNKLVWRNMFTVLSSASNFGLY